MDVIPLRAYPAQTMSVTLSGQPCRIRVYATEDHGMFLDLYVNDALVVGGVAARDRVRMVRDAYLGFIGDLMWVDTQGAEDPRPAGLGTRWVLAYVL